MIKDLPPPLKSLDKRIQKTKKLLLDSYVSLIIERGYANVTVQDIITKAKVGRSTFYSHFENKEQLLKGDNMIRLLLEKPSPSTPNHHECLNFLRLFRHVEENLAFAEKIFRGESNEMIKEYIHNIMTFALQTFLADRLDENKIDKDMATLLIEAIAAALTTMLVSWSLNRRNIPPKFMADQCQELVDCTFEKFMK